jgi:hypothetical protein
MPLQKLQFKPGVDRENTRYAAEGGWYETNKVRFRRGMPQKIGGWVRLSNRYFSWHLPLYAQLGYSGWAKSCFCRH